MFNVYYVTSLLLFACLLVVTGKPEALTDELLSQIVHVESRGKDDAVGDGGKAIGAYQIWESYYNDAVQYDPSLSENGKTYQDVTDRDYATKVVEAYMSRYATKKRLGREPTAEDLARIHNGGPNGYKKDATKKYWEKVKNAKHNVDCDCIDDPHWTTFAGTRFKHFQEGTFVMHHDQTDYLHVQVLAKQITDYDKTRNNHKETGHAAVAISGTALCGFTVVLRHGGSGHPPVLKLVTPDSTTMSYFGKARIIKALERGRFGLAECPSITVTHKFRETNGFTLLLFRFADGSSLKLTRWVNPKWGINTFLRAVPTVMAAGAEGGCGVREADIRRLLGSSLIQQVGCSESLFSINEVCVE